MAYGMGSFNLTIRSLHMANNSPVQVNGGTTEVAAAAQFANANTNTSAEPMAVDSPNQVETGSESTQQQSTTLEQQQNKEADQEQIAEFMRVANATQAARSRTANKKKEQKKKTAKKRFMRMIAPRLATTHTCRNFSRIQEWAKTHHAGDIRVKITPREAKQMVEGANFDMGPEEDIEFLWREFPGNTFYKHWRDHPLAKIVD